MKNREIIFFYPSNTLGGVQTLFIRTIKSLSKQGINVGYCDFDDGTIREALESNAAIPFVSIDEIKNRDSALIVTSANFINLSKITFHENAELIVWFLSPYNSPIINMSKKLGFDLAGQAFVKNIYCGFHNFRYLLNSEALYFMDRLCFEINGSPNVNYDVFLPLFIDLSKCDRVYDTVNESFRLAWVGRIDLSLKFHCLIFLLKKFEELKRSREYKDVSLTVIGSGTGLNKVKEFCSNLRCNNDIMFIEGFPYSEFHERLLDNVDLAFAHGTTCVESASVGIPTICLDGSIKPMKDYYRFKWYQDRAPYDVGKTEFDDEFACQGQTLVEVINDLTNRRREISSLALNTVASQYHQKRAISKILEALSRGRAEVKGLRSNLFTLFVDIVVNRKVFIKLVKLRFKSRLKLLGWL